METPQEEVVVLVNEQDEPIGTMPKLEAHHENTPLHRGVSLFVFNGKGQFLMQQRALGKKSFPGVWSNSVCGHPGVDEAPEHTASRRMEEELGMNIPERDITVVLPHFRYTAEMNGLKENEFCPVMVAFTDQEPTRNPEEVEATQWMEWEEFVKTSQEKPESYSKWSVEETAELIENEMFQKLYAEHTRN